jgi:hypothetical protein
MERLGQPLWKLGGKILPFVSSQVVSESRKGSSGCLLRFIKRVKPGSLADLIYKLLVPHALVLCW